MDNPKFEFLLFNTTDITHPLLKETVKEINETAETKKRGLEILRKELLNFKDIEPCLDETFLLRFLRVSKYDTAKALQRVLNYYQQADVFIDTFSKLTFPLQEADKFRHVKVSPYRCKDNSYLIMGKGNIDYKKYSFGHRFYLEIVILHTFIENPVNQISGGTYIFDCEGMDIHGYLACTPFWLRLYVTSLLKIFPCRMKAAHVVNMPSFFPILMNICYRFMPKKMRNRVFFHAKNGDWKDLHSNISPEILPEKYGGKLKEDDLIDCLDNLKEQEKRGLKLYAFGNIKTKEARQSFNFFQ